MENRDTYFSDLKQDVQSYINDRILLVKLQAVKSAAAAGGMATVAVVILFLSFFFLLFSGLTLGFWLAYLLNSPVGAFAIVLGFYILIVVLLIVLRKKILPEWVTKKMIKNILGTKIRDEINAGTKA
jgi:hypothetical protein